jgi:hypothetical protein
MNRGDSRLRSLSYHRQRFVETVHWNLKRADFLNELYYQGCKTFLILYNTRVVQRFIAHFLTNPDYLHDILGSFFIANTSPTPPVR